MGSKTWKNYSRKTTFLKSREMFTGIFGNSNHIFKIFNHHLCVVLNTFVNFNFISSLFINLTRYCYNFNQKWQLFPFDVISIIRNHFVHRTPFCNYAVIWFLEQGRKRKFSQWRLLKDFGLFRIIANYLFSIIIKKTRQILRY